MATHGMVDLETFATTPDAVILTVGAVKFDPFNKKEPHTDFYMRLEIENQEDRGRMINPDTLQWWSTQPNEIIEEALGDHNRQSVEHMLSSFKKWFVGCDKIWAQGICFDITMLENISRQYGYPIPWSFWQVEDARTIINRMPRDPRKDFDFAAHNALEDARVQAKSLQVAFEHFGFKK
jgi:exodeoxyribonuclease VIII